MNFASENFENFNSEVTKRGGPCLNRQIRPLGPGASSTSTICKRIRWTAGASDRKPGRVPNQSAALFPRFHPIGQARSKLGQSWHGKAKLRRQLKPEPGVFDPVAGP